MEAHMEHSAQDIYEMHAIIKGNVQGVGFRAMTRHFATGLGVTGTVRNLTSGAVEVYAHGSKERLQELMKKLKEEAFPGHIVEASIEFFPIEKPHEDFRIIH
jgi:acylphosphatase